MHYQHIEKDEKKLTDEGLNEIHKMAQIALGIQVTKDCTKWAINEGLFDNFEAIYDAGYRKESDTAKEILQEVADEYTENVGYTDWLDDCYWGDVIERLCKKYGLKATQTKRRGGRIICIDTLKRTKKN